MKIKFNKVDKKETNNVVTILKGSLVAIIITIIGLLILSIILAYTEVKETIEFPVIIILMAVSIIIGSIISSKKLIKKGIINGGLVGLIYILEIYLLSSIFVTTFSVNSATIITMVIAIVAGVLGGIIGVNLNK